MKDWNPKQDLCARTFGNDRDCVGFEIRSAKGERLCGVADTGASVHMGWKVKWLDDNQLQIATGDIGDMLYVRDEKGKWFETNTREIVTADYSLRVFWDVNRKAEEVLLKVYKRGSDTLVASRQIRVDSYLIPSLTIKWGADNIVELQEGMDVRKIDVFTGKEWREPLHTQKENKDTAK